MTREQLILAYKGSGHIASAEITDLQAKNTAAASDDLSLIGSVMDAVLAEFSKDFPRRYVATIVNDGTAMELDGWYEDSVLLGFEYPLGELPKSKPALRNVYLDADAGTAYFATVANGESLKLTYTVMHTLPTEGDISIPASRHEAFFCLVSRRLCEMLAAKYAPSMQPGLGESVNYRTQSDNWRSMAKQFDARYRSLLGVPEQKKVKPAEVSATYDHPDHRITSTDPRVWP